MTSPFVRRLRLGREFRSLREARGLTAEQFAALIFQHRMKVTRLENGQTRPDLALVMKWLDLLGVTGAQRDQLIQISRDACESGWWDAYGTTMGTRQRLYADIESGAASIRQYQPNSIPGLLQTPEFAQKIIERSIAEQPNTGYLPEHLIEARRKRQEAVFRSEGPGYELVLDEIVLHRFTVEPAMMADQLHHIVAIARDTPRFTVRVLPVTLGTVSTFMPRSEQILFTFPEPDDPALAVEATMTSDHVHINPALFDLFLHRYETALNAALSEGDSLTLLADVAERISTPRAGSNT